MKEGDCWRQEEGKQGNRAGISAVGGTGRRNGSIPRVMQLNNRMQAGIRREADRAREVGRDYGFCRLCVTTSEDLKGPGRAEDEASLCQMLRTTYGFRYGKQQSDIRVPSPSTASIA